MQLPCLTTYELQLSQILLQLGEQKKSHKEPDLGSREVSFCQEMSPPCSDLNTDFVIASSVVTPAKKIARKPNGGKGKIHIFSVHKNIASFSNVLYLTC